jgi:glycine/D-amino acid oxidase-like deaminating enzyme
VNAVVVGAGVLGAALARALARAGCAVTIVDQHEPGDARAASVSRSRILRVAHGADAAQTRSALEARRLWLELERDTGASLYHEVGMAWFAPAGDPSWEEESRRTLEAEAVPVERLDPAAARRLFPALATGDLDHVLLEPRAGLLRPRAALRALLDDACAHGAELVRGRAEPAGPAAAVGSRRLDGDAVVWACGAWTPALFPELVRGVVIQQDALYLTVPDGWATPPVPVWGAYAEAATGAGDLGGDGFKIGLDVPGPPAELDRIDRAPLREHEAQARRYLARRFPGLEAAPLLATESCQTVLLDPRLAEPEALLGGEVRLVRHPDHEPVWLLGDGSGHAFKHAPAIAAAVCGVLLG